MFPVGSPVASILAGVLDRRRNREERNAEDVLEKPAFADPATCPSDIYLPFSRGDQPVYLLSQPPRRDAFVDRASSCQRGLQSRTELRRSSDSRQLAASD